MKHLLRSVFLSALIVLPVLAPAQTARVILMEEFSGDWCGWCPYGADVLEGILTSRSDTRAITYHGGSSTEPFRTPEGDGVVSKIALNGWPNAAIDRVVWNVGGNAVRCLSRGNWAAACNVRGGGGVHLAPLSLNVSGTYDPVSRDIVVNVSANILVAMTGEYNLNVIISQNDLYLPQYKYTPTGPPGSWVDPYYQQHVVRKMITGTDGISLTTSGFAIAQPVSQQVTWTLPGWYVPGDLDLTVFISKMSGTNFLEIQQTFQEPLLTALITTPVTLTSFYAQANDDAVLLTWMTASESNNKGWYIERKTDYTDFETIAFVAGSGTTNEGQYYSYEDTSPDKGRVYTYRLKQVDYDGTHEYSPRSSVSIDAMPATTQLHQNFPNPFNPSTEITVDLTEDSEISLDVYDMMGRLVTTLATGNLTAGTSYFNWDGTDLNGSKVPAGMYIYRLKTPLTTETRQMILTK